MAGVALRSAPSTSAGPSEVPLPVSTPLTERLILVPRDRKCPIFRGRTGVGLAEWIEEACMRARHLGGCDQAFFFV